MRPECRTQASLRRKCTSTFWGHIPPAGRCIRCLPPRKIRAFVRPPCFGCNSWPGGVARRASARWASRADGDPGPPRFALFDNRDQQRNLLPVPLELSRRPRTRFSRKLLPPLAGPIACRSEWRFQAFGAARPRQSTAFNHRGVRPHRRHGDAVEVDAAPIIAVPASDEGPPRLSRARIRPPSSVFEMRQMILPVCRGRHVPHCFAAGDYRGGRPYVVNRVIPGTTLVQPGSRLPLVTRRPSANLPEKSAWPRRRFLHRQKRDPITTSSRSSICFAPSAGPVADRIRSVASQTSCRNRLPEEFRPSLRQRPALYAPEPSACWECADDPRRICFSKTLGVACCTSFQPHGLPAVFTLRVKTWRSCPPSVAGCVAIPIFRLAKPCRPYYPPGLQ